jgi:membrane fusion protein, multidrug efflux system
MPEGKSADHAGEPLDETATSPTAPKVDGPIAQSSTAKPSEKRPLWMWIAGGRVVVLILIVGIPIIITAFKTVSTDEAYVNGHLTFVAPRVPGQVIKVLLDDNNRGHKWDLLVQLDKERTR